VSGNHQRSGHSASAALCIYSQTRSVADISALMGTNPSQSIDKGQPVSGRNPQGGKSEESRWILDSTLPETTPLDEHVAALLAIVEKKAAVLANSDIEIRCAFSSENGQGGFVLKADVSKRLAEQHVDLIVSLYSLGDGA
jgi:Domain of unknown function (DUF4279)